MKNCSIVLKDGSVHEFKYDDIGISIKWAFENDLLAIRTPYGVLSLIDAATYDSVMYFTSDGVTNGS